MRVLIIGANGQIGRILCEKLSRNHKYSPIAMIRSEKQKSFFEDIEVETLIGDLENSVNDIADYVKDCDVVIFTAGSGGHTGYDKTLLIDLDGAVKTIEAAEKVGVERFIMVSALQAHNRKNWNKKILPYYVAKHYADRILKQSKLNYTIIRPGGLLNIEGTGKVAVGDNLERSTIPREDVASTIIKSISQENTYRRSFDLISGDTHIADAIREI